MPVSNPRERLEEYKPESYAEGQPELMKEELDRTRKWIEGRPDEDSMMIFVT